MYDRVIFDDQDSDQEAAEEVDWVIHFVLESAEDESKDGRL